mmetsp:Transcript_20043/g.56817  ORF Transcript_20043/g.56817 Transcript_20043/m.56817 type:complete len:214 (+) Transcript_20043:589-1230(+)
MSCDWFAIPSLTGDCSHPNAKRWAVPSVLRASPPSAEMLWIRLYNGSVSSMLTGGNPTGADDVGLTVGCIAGAMIGARLGCWAGDDVPPQLQQEHWMRSQSTLNMSSCNAHSSWGTEPCSAVCDKSRVRKLVSMPSSLGIVPDMKLVLSNNDLIAVSWDSSVGISPVKILRDRSKYSMARSCPSSVGSDPVCLLLNTSNTSKDVKDPISDDNF